MKSYKELNVWKKSMALAKEIYEVTSKFPADEMYGLTSQIRRAAVSVPSNIAEGHDRNSEKEFSQFLGIAKGSTAEVATQILLAAELGYISKESTEKIVEDYEGLRRQINALKSGLNN